MWDVAAHTLQPLLLSVSDGCVRVLVCGCACVTQTVTVSGLAVAHMPGRLGRVCARCAAAKTAVCDCGTSKVGCIGICADIPHTHTHTNTHTHMYTYTPFRRAGHRQLGETLHRAGRHGGGQCRLSQVVCVTGISALMLLHRHNNWWHNVVIVMIVSLSFANRHRCLLFCAADGLGGGRGLGSL